MMKKLKALILFVGFVGPVADLIRAIAAVRLQAPRIAAELYTACRRHVDFFFNAIQSEINVEIDTEPALAALKLAIENLEKKIDEAAASGAFKLLLLCVLCASAVNSPAQVQFSLPTDFVAAGANYNQYAAPQVSGLLIYAHQIAPGTYSFSAVDLTSKSVRPFVLQSATTTGLARHIRDMGPARVFAVGTAGLAAGGENLGGAFSAGGAAVFPLRAGWCAIISARVIDTSIADRQYAVGLAIGWGK